MAGVKFGEMTRFEHLAKESLANYRSANRLLIVSTNLNGFSLANCGRFAKFAKLSPRQPFLLYGMLKLTFWTQLIWILCYSKDYLQEQKATVIAGYM